ncbi:hypothetical protein PF005_g10225 [Phytophthora fragariae]|uniref:PTM/DIR17-like Tudor domain-containing protein n=1 Tax=Phytophthora fragariae TaxID=53985 RepID=A0A6A3R0N8_9STRA|nr:hypothetical protein PF003_g26996 [Phytophthora fragariae]KAE8938708.1 hypothetical protein PF009_g11436 [Phytophthora fragariae]KAE9011836.1 hypothetical protein PF011_g9188 [Phytophthora fragariae]KAE9070950.1 hypothetical protein PF010_g26072 [Phytophthora fragariae]KAE9086762.1 hypothetical protein PF006_g25957 [Phytophthora fragariae]
MPACPAPASASVASSPGSGVSAAATSSGGFSSAPINPVADRSHSRRHRKGESWISTDAQNENAANSGDSPSSSGTQDEDIRSKTRPSSAGSQDEDIRSKTRPSSAGSQGSGPKEGDDQSQSQSQSQIQSLPSLSSGSAALLQLRGGSPPPTSKETNQLPPQSAANAAQQSQSQTSAFQRSAGPARAAREEGNPLIPDEEMDADEDDDAGDAEDEEPTGRDVRIMFHGREVFAEDLIGLRVAKTFAGHGRFLGQVVKFDKRVALYTVVYADGDAEDLTVDGTLQILIQDEIERADPSQPPPAISLLLKKSEGGASPASPDTGDFMAAPRQASAVPRRARIQASEREAQFVISLFENHALPSLVRQGWRVQSSTSGRGETRFVSPSGEIFPSALDVVGYIASENELLTACFPANVHSAILSLLPREATPAFTESGSNHGSTGGGSRKRTTSDSPSTEQFDGKRTRQARDDAYGAVGIQMRGGLGRDGEMALYRPEDLDRRAEAASRIAAYRGQGGMGGRIRMSGDRFVGGETTSETRIQAPPELRGYRRASSRDPTLENPFSSRWSGVGPPPGRIESTEYARRFEDSPGWRERGDAFLSDRQLEAHPRNRIRAEGRYIHRLSARNAPQGVEGTASGTPTGYYRDSTGSSPGSQASPMPDGLGYPQYPTMRGRAGDYGRTTAAPRVSRETASFMSPTDTLGASAAFSMVDVERISSSRPGSAHGEQPRGRSPRQAESQQPYLQHHRRTNSGHSYRGSESHYAAEAPSEPQGEQHKPSASGTSSATSQQQQHE